ncbi:MAG: YcgN family cysteine cluster protein [Pseudomonadota bacterium]
MTNRPFWKEKSLAEMSLAEWESVCDGCGKCCLNKLEDEDTGEIFFTNTVCDLIDLDTCRCTHYDSRCTLVPQCLDLKQHDFTRLKWLPSTCAYKLLSEGKDLAPWHPLVSGDPESVHEAGVSVRSYAVHESQVEDLTDHIIEWLE